jgi:hypothetical protein
VILKNSPDDRILERIRAEYVEMPGMSLRLEQLARLVGVEVSACKRVVEALIETQFLYVNGDGAYGRLPPEAHHLRAVRVR